MQYLVKCWLLFAFTPEFFFALCNGYTLLPGKLMVDMPRAQKAPCSHTVLIPGSTL